MPEPATDNFKAKAHYGRIAGWQSSVNDETDASMKELATHFFPEPGTQVKLYAAEFELSALLRSEWGEKKAKILGFFTKANAQEAFVSLKLINLKSEGWEEEPHAPGEAMMDIPDRAKLAHGNVVLGTVLKLFFCGIFSCEREGIPWTHAYFR